MSLDDFFDIDVDFDGLTDNINDVKEKTTSNKLKRSVGELATTIEASKDLYKETSVMLSESRELMVTAKTDYEKAKDIYRDDMLNLSKSMKSIYDKSYKVIDRIDAELDDGPLNSKMIEAFAKTIDAINKLFENIRETNEAVMRFEERRAIDNGEINPQLTDVVKEGGTINITNTKVDNNNVLNFTSSEMLERFKELQNKSIEVQAEIVG